MIFIIFFFFLPSLFSNIWNIDISFQSPQEAISKKPPDMICVPVVNCSIFSQKVIAKTNAWQKSAVFHH